MTVRALAVASGLSVRFLGQVERGLGNPSLSNLCALAGALGASPSALLPETSSTELWTRPIALIGLRGAGKSTVGRRAADLLGVNFIELDAQVESAAGMSLTELFSTHGEPYYRRLEHAALLNIARERTPCLVATGGGIVMHSESSALLRSKFRTVWLRATPEEHWSRVVALQGDLRPVESRPDAMGELRVLWRTRQPLYATADLTLDTSKRTPDASAQQLAVLLRPLVNAAP